MLNIDNFLADVLLKEATLILTSTSDNCPPPDDDSILLGSGIFKLYRSCTGEHVVEAHLVDMNITVFNLLQTPAEIVEFFFIFRKRKELTSYFKEIYKLDNEEVTKKIQNILHYSMPHQSEISKHDLDYFFSYDY